MPRILHNFLGREDALARLEAHAHRLAQAQQQLARCLPAYLAGGCHVAQFEGSQLVLKADNGALATKLRQALPSLRAALARQGLVADEIRIKVGLKQTPPPPPPPPLRPVPARAQADIAQLRDSLPPDSPLGRALARLLAHSRSETND